MADMRTKYGAMEFDPDDPKDVLAEDARQALIAVAASFLDRTPDAEHLAYQLNGFLTGIAQIVGAHMEDGDESWAITRSMMLQTIPWAVDQARAAKGLPPLPEA